MQTAECFIGAVVISIGVFQKRDDGCAPLLAPSERTQWKGTSANSKEKQGGEEGRRSQQGQAGRKISLSSCAACVSGVLSRPLTTLNLELSNNRRGSNAKKKGPRLGRWLS